MQMSFRGISPNVIMFKHDKVNGFLQERRVVNVLNQACGPMATNSNLCLQWRYLKILSWKYQFLFHIYIQNRT